jgi:glutamate formiminotransferase
MENKKYVINGVKWFDRINGNTYHTVSIIDVDSNETIYNSDITYGYDDAWRQTAYTWLVKNNKAEEKDRFNHDMNHKRFIFIDSGYVTRKKDL